LTSSIYYSVGMKH